MTIYSFIKYFSLSTSIFLIYLKLINKTIITAKNIIIGIFYIITLTLLLLELTNVINEPYISILIIILSSIIFIATYKTDIIETISFITISFAISYILLLLATAITSFIFTLFTDKMEYNFLYVITTTSLQIIFIFLFYIVKFKIILKKNVCVIGNILAGIALIIYSTSREEGLSFATFNLIIVGGILCAVGLFYWIKRESITAYNKKIQDTENEKLKAETQQERKSRQYYEKIVHNDGKKLPAYQEAVESLIESVDDPVTKQKAERILSELGDARGAVALDVAREINVGKILPSTGMELLDAVFTHYYKICWEKEIEFDLIVSGNPQAIKENISQSKLEIIVANLLDNAIISCEHSLNSGKSIVVSLNSHELSVKDNGVEFEPETLELLGKQQVTTHADSGGSGIGFMTVFEIARSCEASVLITEAGEHKTVAVKFDGLGEYRVNYKC